MWRKNKNYVMSKNNDYELDMVNYMFKCFCVWLFV